MLTSLIAVAASQAPAAQPTAQPPRPAPYRIPGPPLPPPPPQVPPPPPAGSSATSPRVMSGYISDLDYPAAALRVRAEGVTRVSLQVGENGRVTGCEVIRSAGNASLDSTTCRILQLRFRYQPATRNGVPVASTRVTAVTWRMADLPLVQVEQGRVLTVMGATSLFDCRQKMEGSAFADFGASDCEVLDSKVIPEGERPLGKVTHALQLLPGGETDRLPPLPAAPFWEQLYALQLAPDGSVSHCAVSAERGQLPEGANPKFLPLCERFQNGRWFARADTQQPRRIQMRSSLYQGSGGQ